LHAANGIGIAGALLIERIDDARRRTADSSRSRLPQAGAAASKLPALALDCAMMSTVHPPALPRASKVGSSRFAVRGSRFAARGSRVDFVCATQPSILHSTDTPLGVSERQW